jgi:3-hydroxyisobutyrate dehydrogenase-like beta-hydroxyacid dehydrogenase
MCHTFVSFQLLASHIRRKSTYHPKFRIIFSMLSTPEASRAVFDGEDGTLAGVSPGKFIIDCATLAENDMTSMSERVLSKGG